MRLDGSLADAEIRGDVLAGLPGEHEVHHFALLVGCVVEPVVAHRTFIPALGWPMIALVLAANGLRWWCIATLGPYWSARVIVIPGTTLVRSGPYRWFAHPNYVAVIIEGAALPLAGAAVSQGGFVPADGLASGSGPAGAPCPVRPLSPPRPTLVVAGCDPAFPLSAERRRILLRPLLETDGLSSNHAIDVVRNSRQTPFADCAVDRNVRFDDFRRLVLFRHLLTLLFLGDRLELHRFPGGRPDLLRHLGITERLGA